MSLRTYYARENGEDGWKVHSFDDKRLRDVAAAVCGLCLIYESEARSLLKDGLPLVEHKGEDDVTRHAMAVLGIERCYHAHGYSTVRFGLVTDGGERTDILMRRRDTEVMIDVLVAEKPSWDVNEAMDITSPPIAERKDGAMNKCAVRFAAVPEGVNHVRYDMASACMYDGKMLLKAYEGVLRMGV
jgi:hypothetical protein